MPLEAAAVILASSGEPLGAGVGEALAVSVLEVLSVVAASAALSLLVLAEVSGASEELSWPGTCKFIEMVRIMAAKRTSDRDRTTKRLGER